MEHPEPDDKNWTWVLDRPCPDCGFDAAGIDRRELGGKIRANAGAWRTVLGRGALVHERPPVPAGASPVWSALEYAAHVRDVYELFTERVLLMLKKKNPSFANWNQDETALEKDYPSEDPDKVAYHLAVHAGKLADIFDRLSAEEWARTGERSDGSSFTVESLGVYLLHDPVHHLWDVEAGFAAIREAAEAAAEGQQ